MIEWVVTDARAAHINAVSDMELKLNAIGKLANNIMCCRKRNLIQTYYTLIEHIHMGRENNSKISTQDQNSSFSALLEC